MSENSPSRRALTSPEMNIGNLELFARATVRKAETPLEMHIHSGLMEIVCLLSGRQTYQADGGEYGISGGDVFITRPGEVHGNGPNTQEINEMIWLQIDMEYKNGFLGLSDTLGRPLHRELSEMDTHVLRAGAESLKALKRAFSLIRDGGSGLIGGLGYLHIFLDSLLRSGRYTPDGDENVRRVTEFIRANADKSTSVPELAEIMGVSESYFKHRFARVTGIPPMQFVAKVRIDRACALLAEPDKTITEIAFETGFESANYFSSVFRKFTGLTPTEYRKNRDKSRPK